MPEILRRMSTEGPLRHREHILYRQNTFYINIDPTPCVDRGPVFGMQMNEYCNC